MLTRTVRSRAVVESKVSSYRMLEIGADRAGGCGEGFCWAGTAAATASRETPSAGPAKILPDLIVVPDLWAYSHDAPLAHKVASRFTTEGGRTQRVRIPKESSFSRFGHHH
jgi:hypothetical protein